jgi:four helix bundle protein
LRNEQYFSMYTYPFEKLDVWQLAKQLVVKIYFLTKSFPADEKFGIVNQMRRAAVSVSSNIAEGSSRNSQKDQANFYGMAYSSLMELLNQLIISKELSWISSEELAIIRNDIEIVSLKINALRKSILK